MEGGPVDQRSVRRHNLGLVLRHVADNGPRSRARIADETGLNKTTVSSLVSELILRELLCETGTENPGAVGRPAQKVQLSGARVVGLGLNFSVDKVGVCAVDLAGGTRHCEEQHWSSRTSTPEKSIGQLAGLTERALAKIEREGLVPVGATVAVPGLVEVGRGVMLVAPNVGWSDTPVAQMLRERLGNPPFPIRVDNEANLGALGELTEGVGRGFSDFIYISGDIGVGAGLVIGGEVFHGAHGFGGEFGHITFDPDGERCGCGSIGCIETVIGREALLKRAGVTSGDSDVGDGSRMTALVQRARAGDGQVLEALDAVGRALGIGLSSLANLLNPQAIVLGGYFTALTDWLTGSILTETDSRVLSARWSNPFVLPSSLDSEAVVRGAAARALEEVLSDPGTVDVYAKAS